MNFLFLQLYRTCSIFCSFISDGSNIDSDQTEKNMEIQNIQEKYSPEEICQDYNAREYRINDPVHSKSGTNFQCSLMDSEIEQENCNSDELRWMKKKGKKTSWFRNTNFFSQLKQQKHCSSREYSGHFSTKSKKVVDSNMQVTSSCSKVRLDKNDELMYNTDEYSKIESFENESMLNNHSSSQNMINSELKKQTTQSDNVYGNNHSTQNKNQQFLSSFPEFDSKITNIDHHVITNYHDRFFYSSEYKFNLYVKSNIPYESTIHFFEINPQILDSSQLKLLHNDSSKISHLYVELMAICSRKIQDLNQNDINFFLGEFYDNIEFLGKGGFGKVFKAKDKTTMQIVAIKVRFWNHESVKFYNLPEIRAFSILKHKNIIQIFKVIKMQNLVFIVMEYVPWEFLRLIERSKVPTELLPLLESPEKIKEIFLQIINVIKFIHSKNIIHHDIKPENILITCDGDVKIIDFGCCSINNQNPLTIPELSTLEYRAPELYCYGTIHGNTVDIYAFGIVLFEFFTDEYLINDDCIQTHIRKMYSLLVDEKILTNYVRQKIPCENIVKIIVGCCTYNSSNRIQTSEVERILRETDFDFFRPRLIFKSKVHAFLERALQF